MGAIAVCTKHELVLAIVGGLFVVEALSVIIQVLYFNWKTYMNEVYKIKETSTGSEKALIKDDSFNPPQ